MSPPRRRFLVECPKARQLGPDTPLRCSHSRIKSSRKPAASPLGQKATSAHATAISVRDSIAGVAARASWARFLPKTEFALPVVTRAEIPSGREREPQLRRLVCKRNLATRLRQNNTTGKSPKICTALARKILRLTCRANQWCNSARLTQMRGGSRSSRTRGGMWWTRMLRLTSAADAYGENAWS